MFIQRRWERCCTLLSLKVLLLPFTKIPGQNDQLQKVMKVLSESDYRVFANHPAVHIGGGSVAIAVGVSDM